MPVLFQVKVVMSSLPKEDHLTDCKKPLLMLLKEIVSEPETDSVYVVPLGEVEVIVMTAPEDVAVTPIAERAPLPLMPAVS